jgi:phosphatidylinositol alpha-mannosyltransferase
VSEDDKVERMRAATVFCAPSLHGESFGVVLVEAMAAGTAVVASGLDGYRNVATDGVGFGAAGASTSVMAAHDDRRTTAVVRARVRNERDMGFPERARPQ